MLRTLAAVWTACGLFGSQLALAQTTVISDNFDASTGTSYDTDGLIGTSATWTLSRSGADWGARINGGILDLTNDASGSGNANGWVFGYRDTNAVSGWNTSLSSNTGVVTWEFNMRSIRTDPAGFGSGSYGVGFILAGTSATSATAGSGYAVVLGQSGTVDPIRLVKYGTGIQSTLTNIITSNTTGLTDFGANYLSVRVTYTPSTNRWELFLRNDGSTAFADPSTGTLVSQGSAVDSTYTSTSGMRYTGGHWQGATGADQPASYDNVSLKVAAPAPTIIGSATATAFTTTYGTASAEQVFAVSGTNLTTDLVATAPTGFEVSSDGSTYGGTATWIQSSGSASGNLRIRLAASATVMGTYNAQNIILTSTGATPVNITTPASGNAVAAKALTISGLSAQDKNWDGTTDATVTGTPAYVGLANSETFSVTGTVTWAFADVAVGTAKSLVRTGSFAAPTTNYSVTQPSLSASILGVVPPAPSITSITAGNQQLSVAFNAPANNGGVSISNYEYSVNGGIDWITPSPTVVSSPLLISGLVNGTVYDVQIRAVNAIGSGAASSTTQGTPEAPADATISVTPAILGAALSSTYGTASAPQNFTVSGSTLSGDLTVTAPTGLEVSLSAGSGYADQLSLVATDGAISATVVYVRMKATAAAGAYNSASITVSGGGAVSLSASTTASGNTQATKELTITGLSAANKEYDGNTDVSVTGTAQYDGMVNGESSSPSNTVTWAFANKTVGNGKSLVRTGEYDAPTANYTVTQPILSANITAKNLDVIGAVVTTRPYNASTTATIIGATLDGLIRGDVVTLTNDGTGTFSQASPGDNLTVTTNMAITGTDANNYAVTQPTLTGTIVKADQTITFAALASRSIADAPFTLTATSTSTLTVSFASSNDSVATVSGNTVTITGVGSTFITASQAGDDNYNPASLERELVVTPVPALWSFTGDVDTAASSPTNLTASVFSRGNNLGTNNALLTTTSVSTTGTFSGTTNAGLAARAGTLSTAANGSGYFEFSLTAASGYKATITDFSFGSRSTSTGPQAYTVRSSADNYTADLFTGTLNNDSAWALKSHTGLAIVFDAAQTYRIYGHSGAGNPSQNTTNWRVDDVRLLVSVAEKGTPSITTAPTASAINEGQTLADSTLSGGVASVPGSFAFTTPATAPAAGTANQSVTFTPTDLVSNKPVTLNVSVTVNAPPAVDTLFTDPSKNAVLSDFTGGVKRLSFTGIPGRVYGIQRSSNLTGWTQIGTTTAPQDGSVTYDDPNPLPGQGFYRIVYPAAAN